MTKPALRENPRKSTAGKNYVLDTNVLLHDPGCISRFEENHVWIPVDVISELDRFKQEQTDRGANARAVHRTLSKFFANAGADVTRGVPTEGGGTLRLAVFDFAKKKSAGLARFHRLFSDTALIDNRILACVILVQESSHAPAILVTKDLNMKLKALAVGIECQDYLNDKVEARDVESMEPRVIEVETHELQRFASSSDLTLEVERVEGLVVNEYVLLRAADRKTMPGKFTAEQKFKRLVIPEVIHIPRGTDLRPLNLGQQCLLDALLDPNISLVTCYGQAGTGKTLMAVAAGLHAVFAKTYSGLTVSRPVVAMGDTLGFLPGTLDEKMRPWLQPIYDAFDLLMPPAGFDPAPRRKQQNPNRLPSAGAIARKPYEALIEQGLVEIEALCYIRGRSIPRRFFVLDEAQQLTPLEAKTVITRMSKGSKLVLTGDPGQIDNPYVDSRSNGLVYARNRLKGQPITAHVCLNKGERSQLAELGAKLM